MPNLADEYTKRVVREGDAPSGQRFTWKAATALDFAAAFEGIPGVTPNIAKEISPDNMKKVAEFNMKLMSLCVIAPIVVMPYQTPPDDKNWIPAEVIIKEDSEWVANEILKSLISNNGSLDSARGML